MTNTYNTDRNTDRVRTTRFNLDADTIEKIVEITGHEQYFRALGYLSTWNMSHTFCEIIGGAYDGDAQLVATYRKEANGPITYQIGAVWHGDHFGFHS